MYQPLLLSVKMSLWRSKLGTGSPCSAACRRVKTFFLRSISCSTHWPPLDNFLATPLLTSEITDSLLVFLSRSSSRHLYAFAFTCDFSTFISSGAKRRARVRMGRSCQFSEEKPETRWKDEAGERARTGIRGRRFTQLRQRKFALVLHPHPPTCPRQRSSEWDGSRACPCSAHHLVEQHSTLSSQGFAPVGQQAIFTEIDRGLCLFYVRSDVPC